MKSLFPEAHSGLLKLFDGKFDHQTFTIDCKRLPAHSAYTRDKRQQGNLIQLFQYLDKIKTPIIYWFEAQDPHEAKRMLKLAQKYRNAQKRAKKVMRRVMPLPNIYAKASSKVLYVGKRQGGQTKRKCFTHAADRMEMHLGYNPSGANQGMQFVHWCDGLVTVNIVKFPKEAERYLAVLEQLAAIDKKPHLGRH